MPLNFEWGENKARRNEAKHGVNFAEAATISSPHHQRTARQPPRANDL